jgi:hypothetical protein
MYPLNAEPHSADFFPRKDNAPVQDVPVDNPEEVTLSLREERTSDSLEELAQFWSTAQPSHLSPRSSKTISQAKLRTFRQSGKRSTIKDS